ncbi:transmembrane protein 272 [Zalophus californianus]|uniref:Transmembrane protein 272 n=1 Tax=Zalophus californianus TaxID=9704 RepID=A0A6J2CSU8_ZALCA|nr:transmembrane protein 272 [Zalophus californianus]
MTGAWLQQYWRVDSHKVGPHGGSRRRHCEGSERVCVFLSRCLLLLLAACFIFVLSALQAPPLSVAFPGMKFLEDCPTHLLIHLCLLVAGIIGALKGSLLLYDSTRMRQLLSKAMVIDNDNDDEYPWRQNAHKYYRHLSLSLFLCLCFILGNHWVFSVYLPDFIPPFQQPQDYWDKTLYLFAVGVLVLSHTVLGLLVLCSGCVYVWSR